MRKLTTVALLTAAMLSSGVRAADVTEADLDKAMKEVQAGVQGVNRALREATPNTDAAAAAAKSVDAALTVAEGFWKQKKLQDAVEMNAKARTAVQAVVKAAESKDAAATGEAMKGVFATCRPCHDTYREQLPDKTYKIKG
jgi:cytochrome c556